MRHVGDRVALIVAETLDLAKDAAELLEIEYEMLPAVTLLDALVPGAPKVWTRRRRLELRFEFGDRDAIARQFSERPM